MNEDRIRVLYIAGMGRSGSTVLGNILGQFDGFFHGGELRFIWDRGLIENWTCGCGSPFRECELWRTIFQDAFGGMGGVDSQEMFRQREIGTRTHHIPLMLMSPGRRLLNSRSGEYLESLGKLYRAIQHNTGSSVIVDSSNFPAYAYALGMLRPIDLYVVHLIRDSRATAYSWLRKKLHADAGSSQDSVYIRQYSPLDTALRWSIRNLATEVLWRRSAGRYLTLRYEDLITNPQRSIDSILEMLQTSPSGSPFTSEHEVKFGVNHTVSGNPNRSQTGTVRLRLDEEWKKKLKPFDKSMVTALTWPLLVRYGYSKVKGLR
ncbi:sulfotransferase [soil metagenome]